MMDGDNIDKRRWAAAAPQNHTGTHTVSWTVNINS